MATRVQEYKEKYSDQTIRFNPYAVKKTGLQQAQTMLKLEDYMLICAPYQLSMDRVILLVILSRDEVSFFQQFQNKLTSVNMSFLESINKNPVNLFIRGTLTRLGPVKGRDNVSLFEVMYKSCPNDLIEIIGDFLLAYETLQGQFASYKDREVEMDKQAARTMRFNDYVESQIGDQKLQTKLLSVGVNKIALEIPGRLPAPAVGNIFPSKLYFQTYQFIVNGKVVAVDTLGSGSKKISMEVGFTPELVEIMDDYFFRTSFKKE
ncbi:MAG: PilZN3 domain-containing protein [Spirochaetia bacterium]